jgi:predicted RNase H-like HicB family nuclease
MQVVALIREENGVYRASLPDFPGCTTAASDPNTVIAKASEALSHHIARTIADGRELPQMRSLSCLASDPVFDSASLMIALVSYTPARRKCALRSRSMNRCLAALSARRKQPGKTRSESLAFAAQQRLAREAIAGPHATFSAMRPTPHSVEASEMEVSISEQPMPGGTASSLVCIREILERLDSCSVKQNRQPIRKPPNMRANQ